MRGVPQRGRYLRTGGCGDARAHRHPAVQHESAHNLLMRAERSGIEVSQAQFDLNSAFGALVKARGQCTVSP